VQSRALIGLAETTAREATRQLGVSHATFLSWMKKTVVGKKVHFFPHPYFTNKNQNRALIKNILLSIKKPL